MEPTNETWEPGEINTALRNLPSEIAKASQEVVEAEAKVKDRKFTISMLEAATRVENLDKKYTASDIKALVMDKHQQLFEEMLQLEKTYEMKKVRLEYLRDLWDSCRKAANLQIEEMRRMDGVMTSRKPNGQGNN
jgi:hypothetical protein